MGAKKKNKKKINQRAGTKLAMASSYALRLELQSRKAALAQVLGETILKGLQKSKEEY